MEQFSIGRTLSQTFGLIGKGFSSAGLFLLISYFAYTAVSYVIQPLMMAEMAELTQAADATDPLSALGIFTSTWYWLTILFGMAIGAFMYAGAIHGFLAAAQGEVVSLGSCFAVGLTKLVPMAVLTLLWTIAITFGFMLLIAPGAILVTLWVAVMPAMVGENQGIFESFGRSRELTRGSRWPVFAVLLIFLVAIYVMMFVVLGGLVGGAMMGGSLDLESLENMSDPAVLIGSGVMSWAMTLLLSAAITAIYLELVLVKEGPRTDHLNEVFG
jgi:hypothetical protein